MGSGLGGSASGLAVDGVLLTTLEHRVPPSPALARSTSAPLRAIFEGPEWGRLSLRSGLTPWPLLSLCPGTCLGQSPWGLDDQGQGAGVRKGQGRQAEAGVLVTVRLY